MPYLRFANILKDNISRISRAQLAKLSRLYVNPNYTEKIIFYPMHAVEDAQVITRNHFFFDQVAFVKQISLALQVGYNLYVKEHPADMGAIPIAKELKEIPNVRLLHPRTNSHEIIQNSDAVIVINSTAGWEAFLYKKPVIVFGYPFYRYSDLVYKVNDVRELPYVLKEAISKGEKIYEIDCWEKFVLAALRTSYQGDIIEFIKGEKAVSDENIEKIADAIYNKIRKSCQ